MQAICVETVVILSLHRSTSRFVFTGAFETKGEQKGNEQTSQNEKAAVQASNECAGVCGCDVGERGGPVYRPGTGSLQLCA